MLQMKDETAHTQVMSGTVPQADNTAALGTNTHTQSQGKGQGSWPLQKEPARLGCGHHHGQRKMKGDNHGG